MMRDIDTVSSVALSPRIEALLTQVTEVPDLETALSKVRSEYIDLKIARLQQCIQEFESKWAMTCTEFAKRCGARPLRL